MQLVSSQYNFIISMGPPCAGKSKVSEYWQAGSNDKCVELDVDSIVSENEKFKDEIRVLFGDIMANIEELRAVYGRQANSRIGV
jgi:hypothetical protein